MDSAATEQQVMLWEGMNLEDPAVRKFREFHAANPHVYARLKYMALRLRRRGRKKYSIRTLYHVLRWEHDISTIGSRDFKLNNNYTPFYARLLMRLEPELEGFFETRAAVADEAELNSAALRG